jgi:uncharacterized membrane protein YphA (DoxX/SURF4 family)
MNILLWILQIALAIKFISVAFTHGLRTDQPKMQQAIERMGVAARPLLIAAAIDTFVCAVGLVLPAASGILPWLTPWAAAALAVTMLFAIGLHTVSRETPNTWASLFLFALAAFVAYGRFAIAPL